MRARSFTLALPLVLAACAADAPRDDGLAREGRDVFGRPADASGPAWNTGQADAVRIPTDLGPDAWTIILTAVSADAPERARALLEQVRGKGKLPDAFLMERNGRHIIAVGSFQSPTEDIATAELGRVRGIEVDGELPYAHAFLAPPSGDLSRGSIPEYDLRNAHAQYGPDVRYTLQIAVYGKEDGAPATEEEMALFRKSAEDAATALRGDGELAFYYHGPNRSMVTVGVFTEEEHHLEQGIAVESARLQLLRDRHPRNLLNGRTIIEKVRSASGGMVDRDQKSFLVSIP
jgi:hypothetical protein